MHKAAIEEGFVRHWQRIGPKLEAIRRQELAAYDHAANWHLVDALLEAAFEHRVERTTSGLVELQRKLHRRTS